MLLFVGIGNPGAEHAAQRHNIGFMAVDAIADRYGFGNARARFQGSIREGVIEGEKVLILKPTTYVNESGRSVGETARFYKIPTENVTVFHDELDLAAGKLRVKDGGGSAGHNGLRSIDSHIGNEYRRVRIGIGHPGDKEKVLGHVLRDFSKDDVTWRDALLDSISEAAPRLAANDPSGFMSRVANIMNPPEKKPKPETEEDQSRESSA